MDDINLIRAVLAEDGDDHRAAARVKLLEAIAMERAECAPDRRSRGDARRASALRWSLAGTGLVAAAVVTVVALGTGLLTPAGPAQAPQREAAGPAPRPGAAVPLTARQFLLAAANQAARAPATAGKYWHARWVMRYGVVEPSGASSNPSAVKVRIEPPGMGVTELWQAADSRQPSWWGVIRYHGGRYETRLEKVARIGYGWEAEFSTAEVRALPADPAALRAVLVAKERQRRADPGPAGDDYVFAATAGLLGRAPAAPAQLAAGYQLLASLPGVELGDTVTDSEGRTGLLVRRGTTELIVHRETYQVLAMKSVLAQGIWSQLLYTHREWTNQEPAEPSYPGIPPAK